MVVGAEDDVLMASGQDPSLSQRTAHSRQCMSLTLLPSLVPISFLGPGSAPWVLLEGTN